MLTSFRIAGAILASSVLASHAQLATEVIAEKPTVRLGDAITVSVRVTNRGPQAIEADGAATAFDSFEVMDPDGKRLPYVGFDGQIQAHHLTVPPSARVSLSDTLDLTDKYLFEKPGRYSIRFSGVVTDVPASPPITIELTPGQMSEFDQILAALQSVCPNGWHLAKDGRGEVAPSGRSSAPGFVLHVCLSHMRGEAVLLWVTKVEAKPDANQASRPASEYLGRSRELFVYAEVGSNAPKLWPKATQDISRALKIAK